ncbi:MAG: hypothetical protein WDM85_00685 [Caulobacteraceae bacterium]
MPVLNPPYTPSPTLTEVAGNLAGGKADAEGVYFNDTMSLTQHIKLVGGLRYDNYAASISNSINKINTPRQHLVLGAAADGGLHQRPRRRDLAADQGAVLLFLLFHLVRPLARTADLHHRHQPAAAAGDQRGL